MHAKRPTDAYVVKRPTDAYAVGADLPAAWHQT